MCTAMHLLPPGTCPPLPCCVGEQQGARAARMRHFGPLLICSTCVLVQLSSMTPSAEANTPAPKQPASSRSRAGMDHTEACACDLCGPNGFGKRKQRSKTCFIMLKAWCVARLCAREPARWESECPRLAQVPGAVRAPISACYMLIYHSTLLVRTRVVSKRVTRSARKESAYDEHISLRREPSPGTRAVWPVGAQTSKGALRSLLGEGLLEPSGDRQDESSSRLWKRGRRTVC